MLTRWLFGTAISLQKIPGATWSHSGSSHCRVGGGCDRLLACLSGDTAREASLQRRRWPQAGQLARKRSCWRSVVTSPVPAGTASMRRDALRPRPLRLEKVPASRMRRPAPTGCKGCCREPGSWTRALPRPALGGACAIRSEFASLIVPRGSFKRAATSAYVNSEKNAASIALRSSGVRTARALRSAWLCCLTAMRSTGSAVPVAGNESPVSG